MAGIYKGNTYLYDPAIPSWKNENIYLYKDLYGNIHGEFIHNNQITGNSSTLHQLVKRETNCGLSHTMEFYSAIKRDDMVESQKHKYVLSRKSQT